MSILGLSKKEVWAQLTQEIGADFIDDGILKGVRVEKKHKLWTIYLDTYTVSTGKSSTTYTRLRAPYISRYDFTFKIGRKNIFTRIAKAFGKTYPSSGDYAFDGEFVIKSPDESLIKKIFSNENIKNRMRNLKRVNISTKKCKGRFGTEKVFDAKEINYTVVGVIKDIEILRNMISVIIELLDEFEKNDISENEEANVVLFK